MNKEQFGKLLTVLRKRKEMSQKELADMLSVSTSAVSKWEHGKNLPDMAMFNRLAEIFQISCDELHNPEKTLEKLTNPQYQEEQAKGGEELNLNVEPDEKEVSPAPDASEKRRSSLQVKIALLIGSLVMAAGVIAFCMSHRAPSFQQVGARYIDDPAWGRVYEIAYVVDGEMDLELLDAYMNEIQAMLERNQEWDTEIVKVSYYDNKKDAMAWKKGECGGYIFLNIE